MDSGGAACRLRGFGAFEPDVPADVWDCAGDVGAGVGGGCSVGEGGDLTAVTAYWTSTMRKQPQAASLVRGALEALLGSTSPSRRFPPWTRLITRYSARHSEQLSAKTDFGSSLLLA
jgi:hypothetical protein